MSVEPASPSSSLSSMLLNEETWPEENLFLNTQAGKTLLDTMHAFYQDGKLSLDQMQNIPAAFDSCFKRVLSQQQQGQQLRVNGIFESFRDVPGGGEWCCEQGAVVIGSAGWSKRSLNKSDSIAKRALRPSDSTSIDRNLVAGIGVIHASEIFIKTD